MKFKELTPNPKNPRKITRKKLEMLGKSIGEFGSLDGILYNHRTKRLFGGHQRQKIDENAEIILDLKYDEPQPDGSVAYGHVIIQGQRFPYREVDWDKKKETAANLAANKGAGDWDLPLLTDTFIELDTGEFDMDSTMFDQAEREALLVPQESPKDDHDSETVDLNPQWIVSVHCAGEGEMQEIYDEMTARGITCKLIT